MNRCLQGWTGHSSNAMLVTGVFTILPYKMSKNGHFEGIYGAFWIILYGMSQGHFDPSQRPFDPSPPLDVCDICITLQLHMCLWNVKVDVDE
jgi:hypothetical protein